MRVLLFLLVFGASSAHSQTRIVDGDTLVIDEVTYRINAIDAPEAGQKCLRADGRKWACGTAATEALQTLIAGKPVKCIALSTDGYGRVIADCFQGQINIGAALVENGLAWAFTKYSRVYAEIELSARDARIGIWQGKAQTAWEFRSERWKVAQAKAPEGCPIKGNISANGKIYHPPWSPWYNRTKISLNKGERWFCDEAQAIAAGWRAPRYY